MGKIKLTVKFEYIIVEVDDTNITIKDENKNETYTITKSLADKNFIYNYCRSCHSFQGSSIDDRITIFDWSLYLVDRKWIYKAVTRAFELNNVVFYNG